MEEKKSIFKNVTLMDVIGTTLVITGIGAASFCIGRKVGRRDWEKLLCELERLKVIPRSEEVIIALENCSEISEKTLEQCDKIFVK